MAARALQELNKPQPGYDEYVSFEAKAAQYWGERIESFTQLNQGTAVHILPSITSIIAYGKNGRMKTNALASCRLEGGA